ncbi:hypothetical protein [Amorphus suaedae]
MLMPIRKNGRNAALIEVDGGDIVTDEIAPRLAKRRRESRFSGARNATQGHTPAPASDGGGVQDKLSALVKQDPEGGAQQEGRGVDRCRQFIQVDDDLASLRDEEAGDLRNLKQKRRVVELPHRPDALRRVEFGWRRATPNTHIGAGHALGCDQHPRKSEIRRNGQAADAIMKQQLLRTSRESRSAHQMIQSYDTGPVLGLDSLGLKDLA